MTAKPPDGSSVAHAVPNSGWWRLRVVWMRRPWLAVWRVTRTPVETAFLMRDRLGRGTARKSQTEAASP